MNWIDFNILKPDEDQEILFTNIHILKPDGALSDPMVSCGFYHNFYFYSWVSNEDRRVASHWMSMPDPPTIQEIRDSKINVILYK